MPKSRKAPRPTTNSSLGESPEPQAQPEGGLLAWTAIFAGWLLFAISWGPSLGYGVFQEFYQTTYLPNFSSSSIAWIGAIQAFFLLASGSLLGPLFDRGYFVPIMIAGCFLLVLGQMMLSLATQFYQIFLAQGVCIGIGSGVVYVPCTSMVANLFSKHRAKAMSMMLTGVSTGGVIYPVIFRSLQPRVGFPWTVRIMGFISLAISFIALPIFWRLPKKISKPRALFEGHAFKEPAFMCFSVSGFFNFLAYWIPLFYVPTFAQAATGASTDLSYYMISVVNAGQFLGRLLPAFIIPRTGAMQLAVPVNFAAAAVIFGWIGVHSTTGFIVWSVLYGVATGLLTGSNPTAAAHPTLTTIDVYGTRWGIATMIAALGTLVGTPIAGALADPATNSFLSAQAFAGAMMIVGALLYVWPLIAALKHDRAKVGVRDD